MAGTSGSLPGLGHSETGGASTRTQIGLISQTVLLTMTLPHWLYTAGTLTGQTHPGVFLCFALLHRQPYNKQLNKPRGGGGFWTSLVLALVRPHPVARGEPSHLCMAGTSICSGRPLSLMSFLRCSQQRGSIPLNGGTSFLLLLPKQWGLESGHTITQVRAAPAFTEESLNFSNSCLQIFTLLGV